MAFFRFGGSRQGGFDDDPRKWFGGGERDRFGGPGGRFGGPGKGRKDKQGSKPTRRGVRGGKNREDKQGGGEKSFGGKRRGSQGGYESSSKRLKAGNNWHGTDRHPMMQALPMDSRPENFEDEWLLVIRPQGRRRIVVAANNVTQSYNSAQDPDLKFESCLPSGNDEKDEMFKQQDLCILDAIYSPEKKEFYIVDMLHWRHYPYYDNEADFRFYCLEDKWSQLTNPEEKSTMNNYPFVLLSNYSCSDEKIEEALKSFSYKIDDLLFMKKTSLYTPIETSDCLKLKLDKLKDVLGIDLPEGVLIHTSDVKDEKKQDEQKISDETEASETKDEDQNSMGDKSNNSPDSTEEADNKDNDDEEEVEEESKKEEEEEEESKNDEEEEGQKDTDNGS